MCWLPARTVELGPWYSLEKVKGGGEHDGWGLLKVLSNSAPAVGDTGQGKAPSRSIPVGKHLHQAPSLKPTSISIPHEPLKLCH